ncbi:MAG: MMPL family transporter, partial [Thermoleophilaceae bacterium]
MQAGIDRLGRFLERRRWYVVGAWLLLLLAAAPFAARQTDHLTAGGFDVPGSGSEVVSRNLTRFERAQDQALAVVLARRPGATTAGVRSEIDRADRIAARLPHVGLSASAARAAKRQPGDASVVVLPLRVNGSLDQTADLAVDLRDALGKGKTRPDHVEAHLVGQQALWAGMQDLSKKDLASAESKGFPIVLLILLAVFGSLAAAALPLALGFASVTLTGAAIYFLSQATDMSVFVTNVASMIGIGVAVDYSLFVLARYREEVRAGAEPVEARRIALRTSGLAVAFSGLTVMISLAGLFLVDSTTIRSMAMGAIIVVAVSILGAVTLLPALMRLLGRRAYARGRLAVIAALVARNWRDRRRRPGSTHPDRPPRRDFWQRWTERVTRRPVLAAVASAAVLLLLAIPALSLSFGDGALRQFPAGNETRVGAELAAKRLGAGSEGPVQIVASFERGSASSARNRRAARAYLRRLRRDPEVAAVAPPRTSRDGRAVLLQAQPRHDPESAQARALVARLRDDHGALARSAGMKVGGATAYVEDFKNLVAGSMWKILVFVLAFSYLVLLVLLRS